MTATRCISAAAAQRIDHKGLYTFMIKSKQLLLHLQGATDMFGGFGELFMSCVFFIHRLPNRTFLMWTHAVCAKVRR